MENTDSPNEWITTAQAGELLDLTRRRITQLINEEKIQARRIGDRVWVVDRKSLLAYDLERKRQS